MLLHEPSRILVPVDFSPQARNAVEYALILARHFGADVQLLHVWPETIVPATWGQAAVLDEFAQTQAGKEMRGYLEELEGSGIRVLGRLEPGDPVETIVRVAAEEHCDLIIMGTHGRTGLSHFLHGSLAEKVVRLASCPVVTLRVPDGELGDEVPASVPDAYM
ncbi:MAG TPA: universal stress protein [Kofleriaceae bacterium]|nr:universal stress protein [Kofleriaceae bacterium]